MGRGDSSTASNMNKQNFAAGQALVNTASGAQNLDIGAFRTAINNIFANNPYTDPTYLANVRSTASSVESGAQNAGNTKMEDYAQRSGENSSNVLATEEEGARDSARRQHDILTRSALDDKAKREQQLTTATAMLGQIPGMYGQQIGAGTSMATGGASGETQLAGQPSWFDSLINAGIGAAGTAVGGYAGCVVKGSLILMLDSTRKPVEDLRPGDRVCSIDGGADIVQDVQISIQSCFKVICVNGAWSRASGTHTLLRAVGGYVLVERAEGVEVVEEHGGRDYVATIIRMGDQAVYKICLDRTHTYCADGIWCME